MRQIAGIIGGGYHLLRYQRYSSYFNSGYSSLLRKSEEESMFQWGLRLPLAIWFNDWRVTSNWDPQILLSPS